MQADKYLTRHAEPEARSLHLDDDFNFVLVLPCYDEDQKDIERFANFCAQHNALLILVVNQPDTLEQCPRNNSVIDWVKHQATRTLADHTLLCRFGSSCTGSASVLLIDRTQLRIPAAQGVGLARKIGADCAYALIEQGRIRVPWIFCTDADATLPPNYFSSVSTAHGSAAVCAFEHVACGDTRLDIATALYELRLNEYVAGLRRAGSPYAFHTIGSTLVVNAQHYAAAHGFPKRAGGEDFYLLNKLVKLAPVISLATPRLQLASRASHRVPFGTGPATRQLLDADDMLSTPLFYDSRSFDLLEHWLRFLMHCAKAYASTTTACGAWKLLWEDFSDFEIIQTLLPLIDQQAFEHTLTQAQQHCKTSAAFARYLHAWFDGFRTLKLLHALRDRYFPLQAYWQRVGQRTEQPADDVLQQLTAMNQQLRITQDLTNTIG